MKKINDILSKIEQYFIGIVLLAIAFILFLNVLLRLMGSSITWAEEVARYSIAWVTFVGASVCVYKGAHIGVDSLMNALPKTGKKVLMIITILMSIAFTLMFTYLSFVITRGVYQTGQESSTLKIPMVYVYSSMIVGGVLTLIRYIQSLFLEIKGAGDQ